MPNTRTVEIDADTYAISEGIAKRVGCTVGEAVAGAIRYHTAAVADGRGLTRAEAMQAVEPFLADAVLRTATVLGVEVSRIGLNQTTGEIIIYVADGDAITIPPR